MTIGQNSVRAVCEPRRRRRISLARTLPGNGPDVYTYVRARSLPLRRFELDGSVYLSSGCNVWRRRRRRRRPGSSTTRREARNGPRSDRLTRGDYFRVRGNGTSQRAGGAPPASAAAAAADAESRSGLPRLVNVCLPRQTDGQTEVLLHTYEVRPPPAKRPVGCCPTAFGDLDALLVVAVFN